MTWRNLAVGALQIAKEVKLPRVGFRAVNEATAGITAPSRTIRSSCTLRGGSSTWIARRLTQMARVPRQPDEQKVRSDAPHPEAAIINGDGHL